MGGGYLREIPSSSYSYSYSYYYAPPPMAKQETQSLPQKQYPQQIEQERQQLPLLIQQWRMYELQLRLHKTLSGQHTHHSSSFFSYNVRQ